MLEIGEVCVYGSRHFRKVFFFGGGSEMEMLLSRTLAVAQVSTCNAPPQTPGILCDKQHAPRLWFKVRTFGRPQVPYVVLDSSKFTNSLCVLRPDIRFKTEVWEHRISVTFLCCSPSGRDVMRACSFRRVRIRMVPRASDGATIDPDPHTSHVCCI